MTKKMNNFAQEGKYWVALKIIQALEDDGQTPNLVSYNTLIKAYVYGGKVPAAILLFNSFKEKGITPDIITFNTLIHGCSLTGNISGAKYFIRKMESLSIKPDVTTFTNLINTCTKAGDEKAREEAIELMKTSGITPNVVTFNSSILDLIKNKKLDDAISVLDSMAVAGVEPDEWTRSILLNGCLKLEGPEKTEILFDKFLENKKYLPNTSTVQLMMKVYVQMKKPINATTLFLVTGLFGTKHSLETYTTAMSLHKQRNDVKQIHEFYAKMINENIQMDAVVLNLVLSTCTTSEHANLAFDCFTGLREIGASPKSSQLKKVAELCREADLNFKTAIVQSYIDSMKV
jgi:pentatricopeptide repeat protein